MGILSRWLLWLILLLPVLACGTLEVGIEPPATPSPVPVVSTATPTESLQPTTTAIVPATGIPTLAIQATPERITFGIGETSTTFTTTLTAGIYKTYQLQILARQQMTVTVNGNVTITVLAAQDRLVTPASSQPGMWTGTIPQNGSYRILLLGDGPVTVNINIPPPS